MRGAVRLWAAVLVVIAAIAPAPAQEFDHDVRFRIGGYFPSNLPTDKGTMWGLEFRHLLGARDGICFGIYFFDEQRTDYETLNYLGTPTVFTFHADVKMQPLLVSWYRIYPFARVTYFIGAGAGLYPVDAFSGGFSKKAGVQVKDVGDFRFLEDDTLLGGQLYGGIDLFPDSRWGMSTEARIHLVENDYSSVEVTLAAILRW